MCISAKVGEKGLNKYTDVVIVQVLLNLTQGSTSVGPLLAVDGKIGNKSLSNTIKRIRLFQEKVVKLNKPDGTVDPLPGKTLCCLKTQMQPGFTEMKLRGIMPEARATDIAKFYIPLMNVMQTNQINTVLRQAHFLAQLAHESRDLRFTEEIADGTAYEGREDLGNTEVGDGKRFKGRGLIQLTGRSNYIDYGKSINVDLTTGNNPSKVATDPLLAVGASAWYWSTHKLNALADKDDVNAITKEINGGYNGLDDRKKRLQRSKFFLIR